MAKIKIKRSTLRYIKYALLGLVIIGVIILIIVLIPKHDDTGDRPDRRRPVIEEPQEPKTMYDIEYEQYEMETGKVGDKQTLSHILGGMGVSPLMIDKIDRTARPVYDMRYIKAGNNYTAFFMADSVSRRLEHFVYEKSLTDYVVVSLIGDSVGVRMFEREVTTTRRKETAHIHSSLWNSMVSNDLPVALSCELEDIYGWSVDFFALQPEDEFTVIFDEKYIDTVRIGIGQVWGAEFKHNGKRYYAIPYRIDGKVKYWDESGNSMKKQFLKAPLKYTRISSKFSNSRMHPIHKVRRPHHGVDYAAPSGTPVVAIADGKVIEKRWDSKGGGNTLKIQHSNGYVSGYLHLSGYAKNISVGTRVSQGQHIANVGSTGSSTGPHLDFRIWKNGKPMDPLKLPSGPTEPIPEANRPGFNLIKEKIMAELEGEVPDSVKVISL